MLLKKYTRWAICFVANSNDYNSFKYHSISTIFHRYVHNRHKNMPTEFLKDWSFGSEDMVIWIWATKNDVAVPAHRAKETVQFLSNATPDFITPLLWPPNSPDLNPVDYKVWSVLQERVYQTRIRDVNHLKQRLVEEWSMFDQSIVDSAVKEWRVRLRACVRANGGHFEFQFK